MAADTMTVLLARSGVMAKTISDRAVVRGYNAGKFYRVRTADVGGFADMRRVLEKAAGIPERDYPDRSSRHFAFIGGLLRAGIHDFEDWQELIAFAVVKLDQKLGIDTSKATRPDYIGRTIGAVLARETSPKADISGLLEKGAAQ